MTQVRLHPDWAFLQYLTIDEFTALLYGTFFESLSLDNDKINEVYYYTMIQMTPITKRYLRPHVQVHSQLTTNSNSKQIECGSFCWHTYISLHLTKSCTVSAHTQ